METTAIDVLQKELGRVQAKAAATDDWFYRLLSVGIVPFCAFVGYCAVNPTYRILVAALPSLSIIGIMVVAVLTLHYFYVRSYTEYLEHRINTLLGSPELHETEFNFVFYQRWYSPVTIGYIVSIGLLLLLNVAAYPVIDKTVTRFYAQHKLILGPSGLVFKHYWSLNIGLFLLLVSGTVISFILTASRARVLVDERLRAHETRAAHGPAQMGPTSAGPDS